MKNVNPWNIGTHAKNIYVHIFYTIHILLTHFLSKDFVLKVKGKRILFFELKLAGLRCSIKEKIYHYTDTWACSRNWAEMVLNSWCCEYWTLNSRNICTHAKHSYTFLRSIHTYLHNFLMKYYLSNLILF